MLRSIAAAGALIAASAAAAQPVAAPGQVAAQAAAKPILVERDTLLRLMVLNEVSTRRAKAGDRFVLRVDEAVVVDGVTIVPVGAKAWGEVQSAEASGSVGKGGTLSARLLHVEVGGAQIAISGENASEGASGSTQMALSVLALGPLALLAPGNNAKLKAGHIFNARFTQDLLFDPATATIAPVASTPAAAPLIVRP